MRRRRSVHGRLRTRDAGLRAVTIAGLRCTPVDLRQPRRASRHVCHGGDGPGDGACVCPGRAAVRAGARGNHAQPPAAAAR